MGGLWLFLGPMLAVGAMLAAGYGIAAPGTAGPVPARPPRPFPWDIVIAITAMILFVAFLAAAETALGSMRKTRLRQLIEDGVRAAQPAQRLLEEPARFVATVQIGITLASMFAAAIAARAPMERLASWLGGLAREQGADWLVAYTFEASFVITILIVGFVELLLGELIPKQLAHRNPEPIALRVAGPIEAMAVIASPVVWVLTQLSSAVAGLFSGREEVAAHMTEEEIKTIVEESEKEGVLEEQETEMIHSVLEFTDIVVREVMVPRIDMVVVEVTRSIDDLLTVVLESGHTRIPIYEETVDNIVGIVHAKDLLRVVRQADPNTDIRSANVMRSVYYVPENMKVDDLLAEFQRTKHQLAVVVDEYGGTAGLVTLEDLLEEIVGPITDEYDVENEPTISLVDENVALVDARMAVDDVNKELGIHLPEEESETLGGFVFGILGKIPTVGEVVEYDDLVIEVIEADSRRVTRVKITRQPKPAESEAGDESSAAR
ncbi:MAG TPA: hemolysin family protein [Armatimonadota bacterium]|nr:hemolysin family protein [Armatimonadota bacterium]HOM80765.1 hemolysin family protein [Armatimonadota bacterium]HPO71846.1 hemolysin family protein [Armatimonadota bacterium]